MRICPDVIAQTTIGTNRMRPSVIRFGILKTWPRLAARYYRNILRSRAPSLGPQYTGTRVLAHLAIPT